MPITESRLKTGTLTLDAVSFATQATNVRLVPKTDEQGDTLEVLSGDSVEPEEVTTSSLAIAVVQDFDDPAGFVRWTWENRGEVVPFSWKPNADAPTISGSIKVRPVEFGGEVNKRLTTDVEFPLVGDPTFTDPA